MTIKLRDSNYETTTFCFRHIPTNNSYNLFCTIAV